jgi:hypothetical protein
MNFQFIILLRDSFDSVNAYNLNILNSNVILDDIYSCKFVFKFILIYFLLLSSSIIISWKQFDFQV